MADSREQEKRDHPQVQTAYESQVSWSGDYNDPQMTRWQASYKHLPGYNPDPHGREGPYGPSYESVYYPTTSHGQLEYTTHAIAQPSVYDFSQGQQLRYGTNMHHVATSDGVTCHDPRLQEAGSGGSWSEAVSHHNASAAITDMTVAQEHQGSAQATVCNTDTHSSYAGSFLSEVQKFVVRHSEAFDLLVDGNRGCEEEIHHNVHSGDMYEFGQPDALEYHTNVDFRVRQSRFLELVSVGDVVRGHVTDKSPRELVVLVTSFVGSHKLRELSDIEITGLVPFDNLADTAEKCSDIFNEMELQDVVQGIVAHQRENGCLVLSFRGDHIEQLCYDGQLPSGVRVGYMDGRRPVMPRTGPPKRDDYLCQLKEDPGFLNPSSNDNLKLILGLHSTSAAVPLGPGKRPTLINKFQKEEFPESEYCHALRKAQRHKWSMQTVAVGVKHFKAGEKSLALTYFNRALEIDATNVEGLVARGALFANDGKFKDGIADFEKALTLKCTHRNARNYLVQTQVAYGEKLEREGRLEAAVRCYREALADEPNQETAKTRLRIITVALEKQAAERREMERKKTEEKTTLKKLQKLIEKEQKRKNKRPDSKKTKKRDKASKSKRKKKVSSRTKTKRQHHRRRHASSDDYSSDESTTSALSETSLARPRKQGTPRSHSSRSRSRSPRSKRRSPSRSPRSKRRSPSRSPRSKRRSPSRSPRSKRRSPSRSPRSKRRSPSRSPRSKRRSPSRSPRSKRRSTSRSPRSRSRSQSTSPHSRTS